MSAMRDASVPACCPDGAVSDDEVVTRPARFTAMTRLGPPATFSLAVRMFFATCSYEPRSPGSYEQLGGRDAVRKNVAPASPPFAAEPLQPLALLALLLVKDR
jgi:hypothetical protein